MGLSETTFELERVSLSRGRQVGAPRAQRPDPGRRDLPRRPSGSGKSTLLRLLDRLSDADEGVVRYRGGDVRERDPLELRREVVLVPQLPALLEGTVEDNLRFAAELAGREPDVGRAARPRRPRCVVCRAATPRSSRSASSSERCWRERWRSSRRCCCSTSRPRRSTPRATGAIEETLLELRERLEIDLVWVTHDLAQARRVSDWLVRIEAGRAVGEGPTAELLGGEAVR